MPHDYSTWDTGAAIREHKLSTAIINGHSADEGNYVFDPEQLAILQKFCLTPTTGTRDAILTEQGYHDADDAGAKGSLTCLAIARHGTADPIFDDRDLELLHQWFASGMPEGQHVVR